METLDVEPPVLLKVEDSAIFVVDFFVTVRPHASLLKPEERVHSCSEKVGTVLSFKETQKRRYGVLHSFLEDLRRPERLIRLNLHNM